LDRLNFDAGDSAARDKTEIDVVEHVQRRKLRRSHEARVESQLLVNFQIYFIILDVDYLCFHPIDPGAAFLVNNFYAI